MDGIDEYKAANIALRKKLKQEPEEKENVT